MQDQYEDYIYFFVIDAYSKWIEVFTTKSPTSGFTVKCLRYLFSRFGNPAKTVSDNGAQFTSSEFKQFLEQNGIKHTYTAPGYPATNGPAENAVRTVKNALKARTDEPDIDIVLTEFLNDYRNSKHCTTGKTPSSVMLKYEAKHRLDLLKPLKNNTKKSWKSLHSGTRFCKEGEWVMIRDYNLMKNKESWIKAKITKVIGPRQYVCRMESGKLIKRHIDQIRKFIYVSKSINESKQYNHKNKTNQRKNIVIVKKIIEPTILTNHAISDALIDTPYTNNVTTIPNVERTRCLRDRSNIVKPSRYL